MGASEVRVKQHYLLKESFRDPVVVRGELAEMPQPALVGGPGIETFGWLAHGPVQFRVGDRWSDRDRHRLCDLVLHRENIGEVTVVPFGPEVIAGPRLDELRGNTDAVAGFAQGALEQ